MFVGLASDFRIYTDVPKEVGGLSRQCAHDVPVVLRLRSHTTGVAAEFWSRLARGIRFTLLRTVSA